MSIVHTDSNASVAMMRWWNFAGAFLASHLRQATMEAPNAVAANAADRAIGWPDPNSAAAHPPAPSAAYGVASIHGASC